jgi:hypothetical protein
MWSGMYAEDVGNVCKLLRNIFGISCNVGEYSVAVVYHCSWLSRKAGKQGKRSHT